MADSNPRIKVIVATHKEYPMPSDGLYMPLHVGASIPNPATGKLNDFGYVKDCIGDNISEKNPQYCELTGLYWAWKHVPADYLGLVHYRRYFTRHRSIVKRKSIEEILNEKILTGSQANALIEQYKIIVPEKREYFIETLYTHYAHTHYAEHLDEIREIVTRVYPDYLESFDDVMKRTGGYMFNMMIMERRLLDQYCTWLFTILGELEKWTDRPNYSFYQGRFFGRVAEIIFNVWLDYQIKTGVVSEDDIKELPCILTEKVNWLKKILAFLQAKFLHKKYETSF